MIQQHKEDLQMQAALRKIANPLEDPTASIIKEGSDKIKITIKDSMKELAPQIK